MKESQTFTSIKDEKDKKPIESKLWNSKSCKMDIFGKVAKLI